MEMRKVNFFCKRMSIKSVDAAADIILQKSEVNPVMYIVIQ